MADEYIRKQDAVEALDGKIIVTGHENADAVLQYMKDITNKIKSLEPADVVPVVHGHWEYIDDTYCGFEDTDVRCSVCKTTTNIKRFRKTKWCPDCGAKMDGEE